MSIEVTKEVWDKIIEADNAPVDEDAVNKFVDEYKEFNVKSERILSTDELIDNYNKYYKKYIELKKENKQLKEELKELRQVRKDLPDIQEPYVILYRQIKKENYELRNKYYTYIDNKSED